MYAFLGEKSNECLLALQRETTAIRTYPKIPLPIVRRPVIRVGHWTIGGNGGASKGGETRQGGNGGRGQGTARLEKESRPTNDSRCWQHYQLSSSTAA